MIQPINRRAINQGLRRWPINSTTNLAGGGSGLSAYAVNDNDPDVVADFAGILNSGTAYYRTGGSETTFADMFTHGRSGNAVMTNSSGNLVWAPHNLLQHSEALGTVPWDVSVSPTVTNNAATAPDGTMTATRIQLSADGGSEVKQTFVGTVANIAWTFAVWLKSNTGSNQNIRIKNTHAGVLDNFDDVTVTNDWQLFEFEVTNGSSAGSGQQVAVRNSALGGTKDVLAWGGHFYRSDLGGMVDNPDRGDSYVPTTTAARYLARRGHYRASTLKGILNETASATNLLHTTGTLVTQSVTVSAAAHTLHFTGTGTVTLSGASTAGPLVGTGTGEDNRVSLTFTPSAGSLTLTVSGTVSNAQLEVGSVRSSYIPNIAGSGTVTRTAETLTVAGANLDASTTAMSFHLAGEENYADLATAGQVELFDWRVDANNRITVTIDTDGAKTGTITLTMVNGGSSASVAAATQLTPGVNKAFSVAWRVTGSEINIALDGTAATATATAIGVPDLSSVAAAFEGRGTRSIFRQAAADWTDSGIESAST